MPRTTLALDEGSRIFTLCQSSSFPLASSWAQAGVAEDRCFVAHVATLLFTLSSIPRSVHTGPKHVERGSVAEILEELVVSTSFNDYLEGNAVLLPLCGKRLIVTSTSESFRRTRSNLFEGYALLAPFVLRYSSNYVNAYIPWRVLFRRAR